MPRAKGNTPNKSNNRTDLAGKVPTMTVPDQTYGKQTAQEQSQKIMPVAAAPMAPPGSAAPQAGGGGGPQEAPPSIPEPGSLPWINHPGSGITHNQPLTTGLPNTPGAGPEAMGPVGQAAQAASVSEAGTMGHLLRGLAARPGASSVIKSLAARAGSPLR